MQTDIEAAVDAAPKTADGADLLPRARQHDFFSATSNTFIGTVYALFGLKNIADDAEAGNGYPQLSLGVHRQGQPRPDLPRRHEVLPASTPTTVAARAGLGRRSPRSTTAT